MAGGEPSPAPATLSAPSPYEEEGRDVAEAAGITTVVRANGWVGEGKRPGCSPQVQTDPLEPRLRRGGQRRGVLIDDLPAAADLRPGHAGASEDRGDLALRVGEIQHRISVLDHQVVVVSSHRSVCRGMMRRFGYSCTSWLK